MDEVDGVDKVDEVNFGARDPLSEFTEHSDENRAIWDKNAEWWDDKIGDGNDFQEQLIEPATERLLDIQAGDVVLDIACGAGRFTRRMAQLGARVVAIDHSERFVARARQRTDAETAIEYRVLDAADSEQLASLGTRKYDKAVCTMGIMDMPVIEPLMQALPSLLKPQGIFVFSIMHPCFGGGIHRFCEMHEESAGRNVVRSGVKISSYLTPFALKTEGIVGQPEPQFYFHRPLHILLNTAFQAGFVLNGIEEPGLAPSQEAGRGLAWEDMPDIPPILVLRLRAD